MQNNNTYWLSIGLIVAALLVAGFFFTKSGTGGPLGVSTSTPGTNATSTQTGTTTNDVDLGNGVIAHLPPGTHIEAVDTGATKVPPPSLTGAINISTTLDPQAQTVLRQKEEALIAELKKEPTRIDLWLQLGVDRKIGSDYQGAIEAWNYVAKAGPTSLSYIAYGDLGDLYMNFVKDYPKAETNYKAAIAINPKVIDYYRNLAGLYSSFYKTGTSAAADIVAQGLQANPNDPDLLKLQAQIKGTTQ